MKTHLTALLLLTTPALLLAQQPPAVPAVAESADAQQQLMTAEQLDQLLGPIALYPDALIAIILPASTMPGDIAIAARYLRNSGDPENVSGRTWDESVKSLAHYPDVVKWMDDNLDWTKQLGEAFREQPADVMNAVQRLRAKAKAAGTLIDTPQQQIVADQDAISIVPAQPDIIYVPYYDPAIVFAPPPYDSYYSYGYTPASFVTFSAGFAVGSWLAYDCDWHRRTLWTVDRRYWNNRPGHDWRRPVFPGGAGHAGDSHFHQWRPPAYAPRVTPAYRYNYARTEIARPVPIYRSAARPPVTHDDWTNRRNAPPSQGTHNGPRDVPGSRDVPVGSSRTGFTRPAPNTPAATPPPPTAPVATAPAPSVTTPPAERRQDFQAGRNRTFDRGYRTEPPQASTQPAPTPSPAPPVNAPQANGRYNARYVGPQPSPDVSSAANTPAPQLRMPPPVRSNPAPSTPAPVVTAPTPQPRDTSRYNNERNRGSQSSAGSGSSANTSAPQTYVPPPVRTYTPPPSAPSGGSTPAPVHMHTPPPARAATPPPAPATPPPAATPPPQNSNSNQSDGRHNTNPDNDRRKQN